MHASTIMRRLIGFLLLVTLCFSVFSLSVNSQTADGGPFEGDDTPLIPILARGIDVSAYQGDVDWARVKAAGMNFVILRASGGVGKDGNFETNYTAARTAGLDIGVYYCTAAVTPEEAVAEAEQLLTWLDGKQLEYPVYFDIEGDDQSALPNNAARTALCTAFIRRMRQAGWCAGVYSYKSWFETMLDLPALMQESEIWWAHWPESGRPDIDYSRYGLWQYASDGRVDGVAGDVDVNVAFTDYPRLMKRHGWNGYSATPNETTRFGDVNGDGKVNTADAVLTLQYAAGLIDRGALELAAADGNGDGKVNTADAVLILQYAAGLIDRFPAQPDDPDTPTTEPSTPGTTDTAPVTTTSDAPVPPTSETSVTSTSNAPATTASSDAPTATTSSEVPVTTTSETPVTTTSETPVTTTTTTSSRPSGITLPFVPA